MDTRTRLDPVVSAWRHGRPRPHGAERSCAPSAALRPATPWLQRLASLKLTLVIIALLLAGSAVALASREQMTWPLVVPLALFAANLGAAVLTNAMFRRQTALLLFHLALIAILLLVAAARLTYLRGGFELAEGEMFDGRLTGFEAGPWHRWRLDRALFQNLGFAIDYAPGIRRGQTRNRVRWIEDNGVPREAIVSDMDPLVRHGYHFYTSPRKGFASVFVWLPADGPPVRGGVHLPAYPANENNQVQEWTPLGTSLKLSITLRIDEVIFDPARHSAFRVPRRHSIILRSGDVVRELVPSAQVQLAGGTLVYEGLRAWMGYEVFYDWTMPWLLAACIVAVLSLAWHFWRKFAAQPWLASK